MSSRVRAVLVTAMACAALQPIQAQVRVPQAAVSRSTLDSLRAESAKADSALAVIVPLWRQALRDHQRQDSAAVSRLPSDTIRVGPLAVLVDDALAPRVEVALERFVPAVQKFYGSVADSALAGRTFLVRLRASVAGSKDTVIDMAEVVPGGVDIFDRVPKNTEALRIQQGIERRIGRIMRDRLDTAMIEWVGAMPTADAEDDRTMERLYVDLLTTPSQSVGRCFAGDLLRCRDALGLTPIADPLTAWYSPAERRLLVIGKKSAFKSAAQRQAHDRCVDEHAYAVCDRLLRNLHDYKLQQPLSYEARHRLLRLAVESGGSDGFRRLASGQHRTPEERLSAAAGLPIDTLVARWRTSIMMARPKGQQLSPKTTWASVAWGTLFGILAMGVRRWA